MSAIFGIWNINGESVEEKYLRKMEEKLRHYGRDAQEIKIDGNIGLGCCLNKISCHATTEVPVYTDEQQGITLVGDALLYNRDELIGKYGLADDEAISTQGLLLAAYRKWGVDCAKNINGDFAFAIWEQQSKQLLICRDHLGVRPLYYFYNQFSLAFATDYRALLVLPFVDRAIDEKTIYANLTKVCNFNSEATCFAKIKALPQAHTLQITEHRIHKRKYWTPGKNGKIRYQSEAEYAAALYALVNDAVTIRVRSTKKKIAAELSGGLDSAVITIIANRELTPKGAGLETFSWSPPYNLVAKLPNDERALLEEVCRQENLECTFFDPSITLSPPNEILPPDAGDALIMRQERDVLARRNVGVVLSGWGGDQGISHRANLFELFITGYWGSFFKEIKRLAKGSPLRFIQLLISNTILQLFRPYSCFGKPDKEIIRFVNTNFENKMKRHSQKEILYFSLSPVKHLESGYIQNRTESAAWMDAADSLQHLYPFLDYRVVNFALSIPRHLYYKKGVSRYIYREAFKNILPEEIYRFISKNDIAKSTYFTNTMIDTLAKISVFVNKLNRGMFSDYIDFNKLLGQLNDLTANDKKNIILLKRRILSCYYLQQILEEAEKSARYFTNDSK